MVTLEFHRPTRDHDERVSGSEVVARLRVDGDHAEPENIDYEIDFEQKVSNLRTGELISFGDDPEEWARGLAAMYRSPYLWATIVDDSDPLPDTDIPAVEIDDPAGRRTPAYS